MDRLPAVHASASLRFEVLRRDPRTHARVGRVHTPHGAADTPAYMPVGTHGAVRALTPDQVRDTGSRIVLANTYHLHLRPGEDLIRECGGLHRFMAWDGPILTDSGGFQVFSLAHASRVDEDGVRFRSHIDGAEVRLTPERATEIQNALGADIIMAFDHCPSLPASREDLDRSVGRTTRWAARCQRSHARRGEQALFGIVQGGGHLDLRRRSLDDLLALDLEGYAIGGVSVGESSEEVRRVIAEVGPWLPADRPRYLMGIGTPQDILAGVAAGVDLFDCVLATRNARNAGLFTREGLVKIRNRKYERDLGPIDRDCGCYACRRFSRAYLRHLHLRKESLAGTLGSIHNIHFLQDLLRRVRDEISAGTLSDFLDGFPASFASGPIPEPGGPGPRAIDESP